jgi:hypothetical protein
LPRRFRGNCVTNLSSDIRPLISTCPAPASGIADIIGGPLVADLLRAMEIYAIPLYFLSERLDTQSDVRAEPTHLYLIELP